MSFRDSIGSRTDILEAIESHVDDLGGYNGGDARDEGDKDSRFRGARDVLPVVELCKSRSNNFAQAEELKINPVSLSNVGVLDAGFRVERVCGRRIQKVGDVQDLSSRCSIYPHRLDSITHPMRNFPSEQVSPHDSNLGRDLLQ